MNKPLVAYYLSLFEQMDIDFRLQLMAGLSESLQRDMPAAQTDKKALCEALGVRWRSSSFRGEMKSSLLRFAHLKK